MSEHPDGVEGVERALRTLARTQAGSFWRDPADLRRLAARRRRVRLGGSGAVAVAAAAAVTLAVVLPAGSGGAGGNAPAARADAGEHVAARSGSAVQLVANIRDRQAPGPPASPGAESAVAGAEQTFALDLLKQLNGTGAGGASGGPAGANVVVSPSSLSTALAMLENGAQGRTRTEIAAAMRAEGISQQRLDAGWAALDASLAAAGKNHGVTVESANSLWLQDGLSMRQPFMDSLARYFDTGVWQVDFRHDLPAAEQALNAWVAKQTHGKITSLFNPGDVSPVTALVLANAVYFDASWKYQFAPNLTRDGPFTLAGGGTVTAPFMRFAGGSGPDSFPRMPVAETPAYDAVQLPYAGGRLAALLVMPTGQSLRDFVAGLTPEALAGVADSLQTRTLDLRLPKFTLRDYTKLNGVLSAMGMPTAFTDGADFSAMSPQALKVQAVVQRAYLRVDEHGTQAAAVTGVGVRVFSQTLPTSVAFDHPFLFLVRDTQTGVILFAAQVQNPAAIPHL